MPGGRPRRRGASASRDSAAGAHTGAFLRPPVRADDSWPSAAEKSGGSCRRVRPPLPVQPRRACPRAFGADSAGREILIWSRGFEGGRYISRLRASGLLANQRARAAATIAPTHRNELSGMRALAPLRPPRSALSIRAGDFLWAT